MNCPKCDRPMEHIEAEPDVNVPGGWECAACEVFIGDWESPDDEDIYR
jgi:hypothetical protein